ncbi:MAG: hypothetical protein O9302_12960 [Cyclobacteriaceae bacterium]|jgi:hypothetical protein|nr:hypothetical protein [Cytophagales bacterium]MCZ8328969.1 hypothetical protein [Cyclobacteriaceae bacterium]
MNRRQYLFGLAFIVLSLFYFFKSRDTEGTLCVLAGLSFITNQITAEPKLFEYKKMLVIATWIFILITGVFFFYVLRNFF